MADRHPHSYGSESGSAVRVGIVGCGRIAERGYVPAFRRTSLVRLVAVADREADRCRAVAPDVPSYASAADLVEATELDVLVIATPVDSHVDDARAAADAGIVALVEKPPARTAAGAELLARLTPTPWVGFNRRFEPRLAALRDRVRGGSDVTMDVALSIDRRAWDAHGGMDDVLLDLGPHVVDLAQWLNDRPAGRVRARRLRPASVALELTLESATARAVISHDRPWAERLEVSDGQGRRIGTYGAGGRLGRVRARLGVAPFATLPDLLAAELEAVAAWVSGAAATSPLATAVEGVRTMAVLDALRASLGTDGDWVVPDLEPASSSRGALDARV